MDVKKSINQFLKGSGRSNGRMPNERYASFDYCYNYFYSFYKRGIISELADKLNIQMSCLQLGFYLASWGMMRGSSFLLDKSVSNYKPLIVAISKMSPQCWKIDADNYNEKNIELLLKCKKQIIEALGETNWPSDTLVTKIMMGVFGNIPAYDQYFRKGLQVHSFNKKSIIKIKKFYDEHKIIIDSYEIHTCDFLSSEETDITYTKAKIIDMCGFMAGQ